MSDKRTWLVALDGSERAPHVLAAARELATGKGVRLVLLRAVVLPVELTAEVLSMPPDAVESYERKAAERHLDELERGIPEPMRGGRRVAVGAAWRCILDAATEIDAAMIVIGAHGYRRVERILGTTAGRVVEHADRSVLVVR